MAIFDLRSRSSSYSSRPGELCCDATFTPLGYCNLKRTPCLAATYMHKYGGRVGGGRGRTMFIFRRRLYNLAPRALCCITVTL